MTDEQISEEAMRETVEEVTQLSELIKNSIPYYSFANPQEKEIVNRIIFSELYYSGNTLNYKLKKGFEAFANRFNAMGDLTQF